jgi:FtsH-binding integral membrane protein
MFIGHFGVGMAAKKVDPSISLGTVFLAAQFLDLLWPTLLLLDLEHVVIEPGISKVTPLNFIDYPISHSLMFVLGWALLFGVVYFLLTRKRKGAILLGCLVVSHWVLDLIVHIPDLPIYPGNSAKLGLGLWNSVLFTILIEGAIFLSGILLYAKAKRDANQRVSWWFWSLIIFFMVIHTMNLLGPPPPDVQAIAWAGQLQWLLIIWGWWADKKSAPQTSV